MTVAWVFSHFSVKPFSKHCSGIFESEKEEQYWKDESWANRGFTATSESIIDSVYRFFVNQTDSWREYKHWAADDFVLYNIQCKYDEKDYIRPQHYYWRTRLEDLPKYFNYSNDASLSWVAPTAAISQA
jgi:hypothetical protein